MTEADSFMLNHPEVAVRACSGGGRWVVWKERIRSGESAGRVHGSTREEAISNYRDVHYPRKSFYRYSSALRRYVLSDRAESDKYRRIVEEYKNHLKGDAPYGLFTARVFTILKDDLKPTHCDKCGQELKYRTGIIK